MYYLVYRFLFLPLQHEKDSFCMSWQYMPKPDGRDGDETLGA